VQDEQRTRILEVMAEVVAERGAGPDVVTPADVAARAGVSLTRFHELFADREACLLAAFDLGVRRVGEQMTVAYQGERRWLDAVKAALAQLLWFLEAEPALGRVLVVHSTGAGARVLRRRMEILGALAEAIDRGSAEAVEGDRPPLVVAEGIVGAVLAVLQNRLLAEGSSSLMDLFGALVSIVVLPYSGAGVARRELTRPAPRQRTHEELESDLSRALTGPNGTRLTYRTARVLSAIDDYPGASNREIAERAGIIDQGQVSKLLARLETRGLIEKSVEGRTRGAPNSWRMTERGSTLMRTAGLRAAVRSRKPPSL
jgi:AcrR family transcriptional regulator/DNA-binding MarR family transcriptional regulator